MGALSNAAKQYRTTTSLGGGLHSAAQQSKLGIIPQQAPQPLDFSLTKDERIRGGIAQSFPSTTEILAELQIDPLSLKANPKKTLENAFNAITEANKQYSGAIQGVFDSFKQKKSIASKIGAALHLGAATAGAAFAPVSALFAASESIPVIGSATKVFSAAFLNAPSDIATGIAKNTVAKLPISQEDKDAITPGLEEIYSLAAILATGKVGVDILSKRRAKLVEKFGEKDAQTIFNKAQELANQKKPSALSQEAARIRGLGKDITTGEKPRVNLRFSEEGAPVRDIIPPKPGELRVPEIPRPTEGIKRIFTPIKDNTVLNKGDVISMPEIGRFIVTEIKSQITAQGKEANIVLKDQYGTLHEQSVKDLAGFVKESQQPIQQPTPAPLAKEKPITPSAEAINLRAVEAKPFVAEQGKTSGVALQIQAKAVEQSLVERGFDKLAEYDPSTIKAQAEQASRYDMEHMLRFAVGKEPLPAGLKPGTALAIAERYAETTRNGSLASQLARSPLASQLSEGASALSLSRIRTPDSATAKIRELNKLRAEKAERALKGKTPAKAKAEVKKSLDEAVKKTKPTKKSWLALIEEIKC